MRKKSDSPILNRTACRLQELIAQYKDDNHPKLPGTRALAAMAGVSPATCYKALKLLEERKQIHSKWGSGFYLGSPNKETAPPPLVPKKRKSDLTAERIRADIASGVYSAGNALPLPCRSDAQQHAPSEREALAIPRAPWISQ